MEQKTPEPERIHQSGNPLLPMLVEEEKLTRQEAKEIGEEHQKTKGSLTTLITKLGFVPEDELIEFIAVQEELEIVNLEQLTFSESLISLVPEELLKKYEVFPINATDSLITLAMSDPNDFKAVQDIIAVTKCRVDIQLASPSAITKMLQKFFPEMDEATKELFKEAENKREQLDQLPPIEEVNSVIPILLQNIKEDNFNFTGEQLKSLSQLGLEAVPILARALKDDDIKVQCGAAWLLSELGADAKDAIFHLIEALKGNNADLRSNAALALSKIGSETQIAVPALRKALNDEHPKVRRIAAEAITKITGEKIDLETLSIPAKEEASKATPKMQQPQPQSQSQPQSQPQPQPQSQPQAELFSPVSKSGEKQVVVLGRNFAEKKRKEVQSKKSPFILFYCPACQAKFEVTSDKIGKRFLCDKCKQEVQVPQRSQKRELQPQFKSSATRVSVRNSGLHRGVKKKNTSFETYFIVAFVLIIFVSLFYFIKQNANSTSQNSTTAAHTPKLKTEPSQEELQKEQEEQKEQKEREAQQLLQKELEKISASTPYAEKMQQYQKLLVQFANTQASQKLEQILKETKSVHQHQARIRYETIKTRVEQLLSQIKESSEREEINLKFIEAKHLWETFSEEFNETKYWNMQQLELEKIQMLHEYQTALRTTKKNATAPNSEAKAQKSFESIQRVATKFVVRAKELKNPVLAKAFLEEAIQLWNSFPEEFQNSSYNEKRNQALKEIQALKETLSLSEDNPESTETSEIEEEIPSPPKLELSQFKGEVSVEEDLYSFVYPFSKEEEMEDWTVEKGNFATKRYLRGQGQIRLKQVTFTEFEFSIELHHIFPQLKAGILFAATGINKYYLLKMDSDQLSLNLFDYEKPRGLKEEEYFPYQLEQSLALFSYVKKGKNTIQIKVNSKQTEIFINKRLAFCLVEPVPPGSIGLLSETLVQFGKLKISGKIQ